MSKKMEHDNGQKMDYYEIEVPYHLFQYLSSENFDIQNLCRICLSTGKQLFPLFATKGNEIGLQEMLTSFTCIQFQANDGLPSHICEDCHKQVLVCHEFRKCCIKSDCTLRSLLKEDSGPKQEQVPIKSLKKEQLGKEQIEVEITDFKDEEEMIIEDIQYLEDLNDSDKETLCIVQSTDVSEPLDVTITDSVSLMKDVKSTKAQGNKPKSHVCSFCNKKFRHSKAVKAHIKRTHGLARHPHSCSQCKESFQSEHDLKLHLPVHTPGPVWTCVECGKEFKGRSKFRRHVKRHMLSKQHACAACGKQFAERYALRRHARVHTGDSAHKTHACHLCEKRYGEKALLAAHVARHTGARRSVCAQCGKAFPSARALASHLLVHSDRKPHQCRYCDKRFRHESTRNTHHRTHTGDRPYVCAACGKRFIQNSNLTLHMRTHTGEKPYSCEKCGMSFSSSSTLKNHARTHTGDKPYSCPVCGKKFARADMKAHVRLHSGERPFPCAVCPRRFITASRLREHNRLHTGEKSFECANCSRKFSSKSTLVKHLKSHPKQKNNRDTVSLHEMDHWSVSETKPNLGDDNVGNVAVIDVMELAEPETKEVIVDTTPDDVSGEIILTEEVADTQNIQTLCLSSGGGVSADMNYTSDNLVTINAIEGASVKLYQVDQSLLQIHSSGGQVTISKITSKMTANF